MILKNVDNQSRKWLLTLNNPVDKGVTDEIITTIIQTNLKSLIYACWSQEVGGEEGTHHLHLYLHFKSPIRFSTIKNNFNTAHIDKARGTAQQNRDYVYKEGKWLETNKSETNLRETHRELGEIPEERQGRRNDLEDLYQQIKEGKTNAEILEDSPKNLLILSHIDRTRKTILEEKYKSTWRDLKVTYIFGPTGVGKTRSILEYYGYETVYRVTDYKNPFDSYNQQQILVLDEYDSQLKIQTLLNLLDGYPLELPCRYANKIACYTKVFIISNSSLSEQYKDIQTDSPQVWRALLRRIHGVYEMISTDDIVSYQCTINDDNLPQIQTNPFNRYSFEQISTIQQFNSDFNVSLTPKSKPPSQSP